MSVAARTRATSSSGIPIGDDGTASPAAVVRRRTGGARPRGPAPIAWLWPGPGLGRRAGFAPWPASVCPARTAWAAASRAMGTRNGEQLT